MLCYFFKVIINKIDLYINIKILQYYLPGNSLGLICYTVTSPTKLLSFLEFLRDNPYTTTIDSITKVINYFIIYFIYL